MKTKDHFLPLFFFHAQSLPDQKCFRVHLSLHRSLVPVKSGWTRGPKCAPERRVAVCHAERDALRFAQDVWSLTPRPVPFRHFRSPAASMHTHPWCGDEKHLLSPLCGAARGPDGGIKHAWVARSSENNYTHLPETERVHPTKSPPIIETSSQHTNEDETMTDHHRGKQRACERMCL